MPFIDETIKSVLGQSYPSLEYIVIDGKSTDGTVEVIKSYQAGISKWISEKDEGIADAFNKGLSFATGEYILFLNADDALATPDVLEHIAKEITQNDYPSLLYGDYNILERNSGKFIYHGIINH
jgi:glycosyltransferase involved in cell wall biosynthesis